MSESVTDTGESARLDKWLWTARLFKTRQLAVAAINGGKVQVNGQPIQTFTPILATIDEFPAEVIVNS